MPHWVVVTTLVLLNVGGLWVVGSLAIHEFRALMNGNTDA